jgi:hypothetical protein
MSNYHLSEPRLSTSDDAWVEVTAELKAGEEVARRVCMDQSEVESFLALEEAEQFLIALEIGVPVDGFRIDRTG